MASLAETGSMAYLLNTLYALVLVMLFPWLAIRAFMTGRYRRGLSQKLLGLGHAPIDSGKNVVWFHGVSVGEIYLLATVVRAFRQRRPDWQCVISTTTETGMAEAKKAFADLPVIFWPFDFSWAVHRSLKAVRPKLVVLAESELWPNFLKAAAKRNVSVMVINGRMSPRSAERYRKLAWLARPLMFSRIARFAMQSEGYAQSLLDLGVSPETTIVTGSVKYDGVVADRQSPQAKKLAALLGFAAGDLVWVAGSTHAPEEEIVLDVFRRLKVKHPELRLVLVPRSPDRFDEVARLIDRRAFSFVRKSRLVSPPGDRPAVILIDTLGDLSAAWALADVGFTGGSLDGKRGGQSMIEPAGLGVPVVFGPHTWNFRDAALRLIEVNAAIRVAGDKAMERELLRLLDDAALRERMGTAARAMVAAQHGATERTLDAIDDVLKIDLPVRRKAA
jgi:3-deoxy-D-manno-octulosonic-acid transferase